ncbi:MAG: shikimate kinase [Flavobacteriaceae bacterium]|nr:shikimate kinase [Flavobacteriaceae bacterium]
MKIILLGYMGSGKSTIGKLLAKSLQLPFIDLDDYIELHEELTITEIFETKGEIYFRKIESIYLNKVLQKKDSFILSIGGGTPCYGNNISDIKNSEAISIYLQASIPLLVKRLKLNKEKRPLIASFNDEQLIEYIGKHLFERNNFYNKANHIVKTDNKNRQTIIDEIKELLN